MLQVKCPSCSREFVRRVVRAGLRDRLAGWFFIYPFKCQICGLRFRSLQWGVRYLRLRADHRDYDRLAMNFPVLFRGDRFDGTGSVTDISMGGCRFTTASMRLELKVSDQAAPVIVELAVLRDWHDQVAGVEFLRCDEKERERLQLFVHGLLIGRRS